MKIILLILALIPAAIFAQVNPWESKATQNPWGETEATPKEKVDSNIVVVQKIDSTILNKEIVGTNEIDTVEISKLTSVTTTKTQLSHYELMMVRNQARADFIPGGTWFTSVISSGFLSIFALPINFGASFITSKKEVRYLAEYKIENPAASDAELKAVKKGIKQKKHRAAVGGSVIGAVVGFILIFIVF